MKNSFVNWVQKALASVLFLGYIPFASGTIGSLFTVAVLWWACCRSHLALSPAAYWAAALALCALSILLSSRPKELFGSDDPKEVIIDECAGQFVTFLFVPLSIKTLVLGFFLFRFFDIVKPFPVHTMEICEGGVGITMDDVMAGILSNISLCAVLWSYHAVKAVL
jgi:phosphatidylglycerophosphatase A